MYIDVHLFILLNYIISFNDVIRLKRRNSFLWEIKVSTVYFWVETFTIYCWIKKKNALKNQTKYFDTCVKTILMFLHHMSNFKNFFSTSATTNSF